MFSPSRTDPSRGDEGLCALLCALDDESVYEEAKVHRDADLAFPCTLERCSVFIQIWNDPNP